MQCSLYLFSNFILSQVFKHSKWMYLIDPLHLHGLRSGLEGLEAHEQHILHMF
jgi:hypothetical protein